MRNDQWWRIALVPGHSRDRLDARPQDGFDHSPSIEMLYQLIAALLPGRFPLAGGFLETGILTGVACGPGSRPQAGPAGQVGAIGLEFGSGTVQLAGYGSAVGYPDKSVAVRHWHPRRAALSDYVQWHDQVPPAAAGAA